MSHFILSIFRRPFDAFSRFREQFLCSRKAIVQPPAHFCRAISLPPAIRPLCMDITRQSCFDGILYSHQLDQLKRRNGSGTILAWAAVSQINDVSCCGFLTQPERSSSTVCFLSTADESSRPKERQQACLCWPTKHTGCA